ncbi:MAG: hypothetical protein JW724_02085 [Candidatus Altiarchaeota archaeon]|nr:hypothetical protein [Candidatus Altiarchaeota archaeon]
MTYGWAIVVIAVALLVLWQWGVFNPSGQMKASYLGFWGVSLLDFQYKSGGDMEFSFQNAIVEGDINITEVNVTAADITYSTSTGGSFTPIRVSSGNKSSWSLPASVSGFSSGNPGESYNVFISIDYVDDRLGSDVKLRSSGSVQGTME